MQHREWEPEEHPRETTNPSCYECREELFEDLYGGWCEECIFTGAIKFLNEKIVLSQRTTALVPSWENNKYLEILMYIKKKLSA